MKEVKLCARIQEIKEILKGCKLHHNVDFYNIQDAYFLVVVLLAKIVM